jgi:hypothetical protein
MHEDATKQLRTDRRLAGRRGWIAHEELERELKALPDVAEKADVIDAPNAGRAAEPPPQGS